MMNVAQYQHNDSSGNTQFKKIEGEIILLVFMDESGNTGNQVYKKSWNFKDQPIFVLCAICIPQNINFDNEMQQLFRSNNIQGELKFSNKSHRKLQEILIPQLCDILIRNNCNIFIESVNKKYAVSTYVSEYCIMPYYDLPLEKTELNIKFLKMCFANYVYNNAPDVLLGEFANLFDNNALDINLFVDKCKELKYVLKNESVKVCIDQTIDLIIRHKEAGLQRHNLFPLIDYNKGKNSTIAIAPQIDSFNNIISRIAKINKNFKMIHDMQNQFSYALNEWAEKRCIRDNLTCDIGFGNSKTHKALQVADYFAGSVRSILGEINSNKQSIILDYPNNNLNKYLNFVSSFDELSRVFPTNIELLMYKECYDDYFKC